jgi:hypothetical protein
LGEEFHVDKTASDYHLILWTIPKWMWSTCARRTRCTSPW